MLESQRKLLERQNSKYLNIGITKDGAPRNSIRVPWEQTASAFNMKTPHVYFSGEDLRDPGILAMLKNYRVLGCYIFDPLEDYAFLEELKGLRDIHIRYGSNLTDISFLAENQEWFMFYLEDACLEDLEPLFPKERGKGMPHSYCVGLVNCKVADISALEQEHVYLSELLVIQPEGTNERARWEAVRAGTYRYYEYRE